MKIGIYRVKGGSMHHVDIVVLGVLSLLNGVINVFSLGTLSTDWEFRYTTYAVKRSIHNRMKEHNS